MVARSDRSATACLPCCAPCCGLAPSSNPTEGRSHNRWRGPPVPTGSLTPGFRSTTAAYRPPIPPCKMVGSPLHRTARPPVPADGALRHFIEPRGHRFRPTAHCASSSNRAARAEQTPLARYRTSAVASKNIPRQRPPSHPAAVRRMAPLTVAGAKRRGRRQPADRGGVSPLWARGSAVPALYSPDLLASAEVLST